MNIKSRDPVLRHAAEKLALGTARACTLSKLEAHGRKWNYIGSPLRSSINGMKNWVTKKVGQAIVTGDPRDSNPGHAIESLRAGVHKEDLVCPDARPDPIGWRVPEYNETQVAEKKAAMMASLAAPKKMQL